MQDSGLLFLIIAGHCGPARSTRSSLKRTWWLFAGMEPVICGFSVVVCGTETSPDTARQGSVPITR